MMTAIRGDIAAHVRMVLTEVGRKAIARALAGDELSRPSVFAVGSGGWTQSSGTYSELLGYAGDTTSFTGRPKYMYGLVPGTVKVSYWGGELVDDGAGHLSGGGSGLVDYGSGKVTVEFGTVPLPGTDVVLQAKLRGAESPELSSEVHVTTGARGMYSTVLREAPIVPGTVQLSDGSSPQQVLSDAPGARLDQVGALSGDGSGHVQYGPGVVMALFSNSPVRPVTVRWKSLYWPGEPNTSLTALLEPVASVSLSSSHCQRYTDGKKVVYDVTIPEYEATEFSDVPILFECGILNGRDELVFYGTFRGVPKYGSMRFVATTEVYV